MGDFAPGDFALPLAILCLCRLLSRWCAGERPRASCRTVSVSHR
jgi:hypothetical protein